MVYRVKLPQVGESVTEAVIGRWLRQTGEHVDKFDPIVEVVTDKVSMEFPAPASGRITRIVSEEGASVPMGAVIAEMELDDPASAPADDAEAGEERRGDAAGTDAAVGRVGRMVTGANVGPTGGVFADASAPAGAGAGDAGKAPPPPGAGQPGPGAAARPDTGDLSGRLSPVVVRLAAQHGIDLATVAGTGIGGRVTRLDVLAAVAQARPGGAATAATPGQVPPARTTGTDAADAGSGSEMSFDDGDRLVDMSPVRKIIASRMVRSATEIPHAWSAVEVDVSGMVKCRESRREEFRSGHGVDLSFVAFTLHAIAGALRTNPLVNSSWDNGKLRIKGRINVGVAVAAPQGLVVPVLRDVDRLSIAETALALGPLVERAREDRLVAADVRDGTFTLNNTGALGSVWGMAIINYPQAAIINTEAIVKRPVVVNADGADRIEVRSMMNISLSFDHRVLDGAGASAFMQDVKRRIEAYSPDTELG